MYFVADSRLATMCWMDRPVNIDRAFKSLTRPRDTLSPSAHHRKQHTTGESAIESPRIRHCLERVNFTNLTSETAMGDISSLTTGSGLVCSSFALSAAVEGVRNVGTEREVRRAEGMARVFAGDGDASEEAREEPMNSKGEDEVRER